MDIKTLNDLPIINISYNITLYAGKQRSGKTLSMVNGGYHKLLDMKYYCMCVDELLKLKIKIPNFILQRYASFKKFELWSNLTLNKKYFGNYKKIGIKELTEIYENKVPIHNKLILIDDLFKAVDNRKFMDAVNIIMSYFITEVAKGENIFDYVSHTDRTFERRIKDHTENFVYCKKGELIDLELPNGYIISNVFKESDDYYKLINSETELKSMVIEQSWCTQEIDFLKDWNMTRSVDEVKYIEAHPVFKLYNTKESV